MKAINKNDLIIVLNAVKDRSTLDLNDLKTLLDEFGDEYFIKDGKEVKTNLWTAICDILGVEPWSEMIVIDKESMRNVGNE